MTFQPGCSLEALASGPQTVAVEGREVAVFLIEGQVYAIDNLCPHRGGPLGQGDLSGHLIHCPVHAWAFDVRTGVAASNPGLAIATYRTRVVAGWVQLGPKAAVKLGGSP